MLSFHKQWITFALFYNFTENLFVCLSFIRISAKMNMLTSPFKKPTQEQLASASNTQPSAAEPSHPDETSTVELKAMLLQQ